MHELSQPQLCNEYTRKHVYSLVYSVDFILRISKMLWTCLVITIDKLRNVSSILKVDNLTMKVFSPFFSDWYYHAPSKRVAQPAKPAPAASQIPGIGGLPDELANPEGDDRHFRRKWIRDTDSKYIKLAKGGGRKNLLTFRSPQVKAEEPVPYPRVEWFDHEHPEEEVDESSHEFVVQNEEENKEKKQG